MNYDNFAQSLKNLETQYRHYQGLDPSYPEWVKEGMAESVIQRFEICYDCLWKVLKRYLEQEEGRSRIPDSPKGIFRVAAEVQVLASPVEQWLKYIKARIGTTHDYSGTKAKEAIVLIADFIADSIDLYQTMAKKKWE